MKRFIGEEVDGTAESEIVDSGNCPVCGSMLDMRDLGAVLAHVHDQEIEIGQYPEPSAFGPLH